MPPKPIASFGIHRIYVLLFLPGRGRFRRGIGAVDILMIKDISYVISCEAFKLGIIATHLGEKDRKISMSKSSAIYGFLRIHPGTSFSVLICSYTCFNRWPVTKCILKL